MSSLDWIFLAGLCGSLLLGAWRGLVFEVLSLLGWLAAFLAAQAFAAPLAAALPISPEIGLEAGDVAGDATGRVRQMLAFGLIFVAVAFGGGLLAATARRLLGAAGLRPVDRALGAAFGAGRALVLGLALALLVALTPWRGSAAWQAASGARWLDATLVSLAPWLPGPLAAAVTDGEAHSAGEGPVAPRSPERAAGAFSAS